MYTIIKQLFVLLLVGVIAGCASPRTFHDLAREGDTVAVAAGWKHTFAKDNITVTITPASGPVVTYLPNDPAIRGVTNFYIDPVSSAVVSRQLNTDLTPFATTYTDAIAAGFTGDDKDWWQTVVILDLPTPLATGVCTIDISTPEAETTQARLDIVTGAGEPNPLVAQGSGPMTADQLAALARVDFKTVDFIDSGTVPQAIQVDLTYDADADHGGTGYAYVVNPIGYIKSVAWSTNSTGDGMRVIITPTRDGEIVSSADFKFYVAGGINNLSVSSVQAFDSSGSTVTGVSATVN